MKLFIALHLFFVAAHSFGVVAAEIAVAVLHPLADFSGELRDNHSDELWNKRQNLSLA